MQSHKAPDLAGAYDWDNSSEDAFAGVHPIDPLGDDEDSELYGEFGDGEEAKEPALYSGCGNCFYITIVSLLTTSNFMTAFTMGPFIADLIVDFGVVESQGDAPKYAGLVSLFPYLGQAVSVLVACRLANLLGTKPVLIAGALLHNVLMVLLAFTTNFPFLVIIRTLQGCFTATLQVSFVAIGQREMSQAWKNWGLGVVNSFANFGFIVGACLGGFLSRPVEQYTIFQNAGFVTTLFETFPLFLVYVVSGIIGFVALFLACFIPESSRKIRLIHAGLPPDEPEPEAEAEEEQITDNDLEVEKELALVADEDDNEDEFMMVEMKEEEKDLSSSSCGQTLKKCCSSPVFRRIPLSVIIAWYFVRGATMLTSHTLPIVFNLHKEFGGFGFSNYQVGLYGWIDGGFAVRLSLLIFTNYKILFGPITPLVTRFINAVHLMRVAPFLIVPAIVLYPELRNLEGAYLWLALVGITCARQMFRQLIFTNILLLMDQSVPPDAKPTLQAIAGCGGYAGAGIGPYLGSALLSLGASVNTFPIDAHLCLLLGAGFYVGSAVVAFFLPLSLGGEGAPCTGGAKKKGDAKKVEDPGEKKKQSTSNMPVKWGEVEATEDSD